MPSMRYEEAVRQAAEYEAGVKRAAAAAGAAMGIDGMEEAADGGEL